MKIVTLAAAAAALVGSTVLAFAVDATGTITAVNWGVGTITLDNGNVYVLPPSLSYSFPVAIGMKVKITQEQNIIEKIAKA